MCAEHRVSRKVLSILNIAIVLLLCSGITYAAGTWGSLSVGKFYGYSVQPSVLHPDRWPVDIDGLSLSDGARLTDDVVATRGTRPGSEWVGWYGRRVSITVDLGQVYAVSQIGLHACSQASLQIRYPYTSIWTSTDGVHYTLYGSRLLFPRDSAGFSTYAASNKGWVNARWIKYSLVPTGPWILIDEVSVYGSIPNTPKLVPTTGCYHGAFPTDSYNYMNIPQFESLAGRSIKIALWYADWENTFQNEIGYIIDNPGFLGGRYMEVGFEPHNLTAEDIASGSQDAFLYQWFTDWKNKDYPIFLRPMSEMNGGWTWPDSGTVAQWGGIPQTYKWAWRRMYNIAEQAGCTGTNQIFVWSPDLYHNDYYPNTDLALYYPGDQYTDWVGCSCYSNPGYTSFVDHVARWYGLYSANKPLMISEGGSLEADDPNWKGDVWMNHWFYHIEHTYPQIKAFVWFHNGDFRIDTNANSLSRYRAGIQNPYYIGQ